MQFAQADTQTKNCKRASTFPDREEFKFFSQRLNKKNKTPDTQAITAKFTADRHRHGTTEKEGYAGNKGFAIMAADE